jgi:hypothetical protein
MDDNCTAPSGIALNHPSKTSTPTNLNAVGITASEVASAHAARASRAENSLLSKIFFTDSSQPRHVDTRLSFLADWLHRASHLRIRRSLNGPPWPPKPAGLPITWLKEVRPVARSRSPQ